MKKNLALLLCFFFGHAVFHFLAQSFAVLLPSIQQTFGVTPVQIGALITVREIATGLISLPGGMLSDYFAKHRALLLSGCLLLYAIAWLLIGWAPYFAVLSVGMVLIAAASAVWHLPSLVELGARFPDRRGTVFAIHGAGGSSGDIVGPMATGMLLAYFSWREILTIYTALPLVIAVWTFLLISRLYRRGPTGQSHKAVPPRTNPKENLRLCWAILKTTDIWLVNVVAGLRSMCFTVLITFLPIYMHDSGFSAPSIGFHFGLLWAIGLLASPAMGFFSDRWGRKIVLVPALLYSSMMVGILAFYGTGPLFTLLIVLLGFSIRSDYSLINATIIDIVKGKVENTMLGILSFSRSLMGAVAPLLAGFLYQQSGMRAALLFISALFMVAAVLFSIARLDRAQP
ncbi:MAG: MFS transporter [Desulfofustis sp.]|jgi:FSR family fosmidomycin resistance protein-like MFS transporter